MKHLHIPLRSAFAQRNLGRTFPARVELGIHVFPYTPTPFPHYNARVISRDREEQKGWGSRSRKILLHVFGNEKQVKEV